MKAKKTISILLIMTVVISMISAFNAEAARPVQLKAEKADEWTALFDRKGQKKESTWLGADGIYSVALDGNDAFASATKDTNTFFIFSDTLMGTSNNSGKVLKTEFMPSQTSALLKGNTPDTSAIEFVYGRGGNMRLGQHLFGEHKWMLDCFVVGSNLYILGFPQVDWKPAQIDMITLPIDGDTVKYNKYKETQKIEELWYRDGDTYLYAYGIGVTCNTESAGAPDPDGYIYIYGYRDAMKEFSRKDMLVSRIKESDFPDFSKLTYWNGSDWCTDIQDSAPVISAVSCEMSVTPVTVGPYTGKYIAVYTQNTQSADIMYAIGDNPWGPFDTPVKVYTAPEHDTPNGAGDAHRYVYNAKAHPHISEGDLLLVSYNVNDPDISKYTYDYHPRFITIDLDPEHEYVRDEEGDLTLPEETPNDTAATPVAPESSATGIAGALSAILALFGGSMVLMILSIVGISLGSVAIIGGAILLIILAVRKKKKRAKNE